MYLTYILFRNPDRNLVNELYLTNEETESHDQLMTGRPETQVLLLPQLEKLLLSPQGSAEMPSLSQSLP